MAKYGFLSKKIVKQGQLNYVTFTLCSLDAHLICESLNNENCSQVIQVSNFVVYVLVIKGNSQNFQVHLGKKWTFICTKGHASKPVFDVWPNRDHGFLLRWFENICDESECVASCIWICGCFWEVSTAGHLALVAQ